MQAVLRPRLAEELAAAHAFDKFHLRDYLLWGQLAEQYLAQARGQCATYLIHIFLYEPKIPWYEWIQHFVDVWSPREKIDLHNILHQQELMGAQGLGTRPEVAATLGLGAALVTAATVRKQLGERALEEHASDKASEMMRDLMPKVLK